MKKATIARFVIGGAAIFAAFGLAACGAETGAPEAEGVGQASEAITVSSLADSIAAAEGAASCVVHDGTAGHVKDFVLKIGGVTSAGAYSRAYELIDPSAAAGSQVVIAATNFGTASSDERAFAQAIQLGSNSADCLYFGGENDSLATRPKQAFKFSLSDNGSGVVSIGVSQAGKLNTGRVRFEKVLCGSNVLLFGGLDNTTYLTQTELYSGETGTTTWGTAQALNTARADFGLIKSPTADSYLIAGGVNGTGPLASLEQFTKVTTCADTRGLPAAVLANGREGLKLVHEGHTGHYLAVAGTVNGTTPGLTTVTEDITVDFATPANTSVSGTAGPALPTAVHAPAIAVTSAGRFLLVGGDDKKWKTGLPPFNATGSTITSANVMEFNVTANSGTTGNWTSPSQSLAQDRVAAILEYVPTWGFALTAAGVRDVTGTLTDRTSMEKIAH